MDEWLESMKKRCVVNATVSPQERSQVGYQTVIDYGDPLVRDCRPAKKSSKKKEKHNSDTNALRAIPIRPGV